MVLNPEYHGPLSPLPPPIPPTIPSWTPPPPPVDLTTPAPPAQQDVGFTQEPSKPMEKFTWDKNDDELIKAIFKSRASKRFSGMMEDVWKGTNISPSGDDRN
ncbi:hypothetical protein PIB30_060599 [Stylosanthes scabra]|uniref:Myb-like domain-containing protein n=1 Tax=Stylosanthes scabra TaxID=79078 RepID=A0ABU6RKJ2_9FABA|nr:hypothetical protein [Stylosanthes scabra]